MLRLTPIVIAVALAAATWSGHADSAQSKSTGDTPEARRATDALNILEAKGYCSGISENSLSAFTDFAPQGENFVAHVSQNGRSFTAVVNPSTGEVTCSN